MNNKFKAGDFTSGKMGEIFKSCFIKDLAIINHKQFGRAYMVPEEIIAVGALAALEKNCNFQRFSKGLCGKDSSYEDFLKENRETQMHHIEDFFETEFDSWLDVLMMIHGE